MRSPSKRSGRSGDTLGVDPPGTGPVNTFDIAVIGGGIAGVSAAAELGARGRSVILLERETALAFHTTGRSAALLFRNYGHPDVRPLTAASIPKLEQPDPTLVDGPLLRPRGALVIGGPGDEARLETMAGQSTDVELVDGDAAQRLFPPLRPVAGGVYEPGAADIDVSALHQSFVRALRRHGVEVRRGRPVVAIERSGGRWRIRAGEEDVWCTVVVDAAGAWGDQIAEMAGVRPVGLVPKRRTAFTVVAPMETDAMPLVTDVDMTWYIKPDGATLLCSPADETPSPPCDARPEEVDVALGIERINEATTLEIRSIRASWAGLRTFAPDGSMVIGPALDEESFFWLVGQGGTGIQTAPACGALVADLVIDGHPRPELERAGVRPDRLGPERFMDT